MFRGCAIDRFWGGANNQLAVARPVKPRGPRSLDPVYARILYDIDLWHRNCDVTAQRRSAAAEHERKNRCWFQV